MLVTRWQAPVLPTLEQVKEIFHAEGLDSIVETYTAGGLIASHRHPFDEVRMVVSGEIHFNVAGNKLKLSAGDKIEIPSNTKHVMWVDNDGSCISITADRPFRA